MKEIGVGVAARSLSAPLVRGKGKGQQVGRTEGHGSSTGIGHDRGVRDSLHMPYHPINVGVGGGTVDDSIGAKVPVAREISQFLYARSAR